MSWHHTIGLPLETRFWQRVKRSDGCWLWLGNTGGSGYGQISTWDGQRQQTHYAHRLSYEWAFGPIPDGLCVCHHCDNPPCVRPDHLFLGTHRDNLRDAQHKGRFPTRQPRVPKPRVYVCGEAHRWAKLTEECVREIRASYASGLLTMERLAHLFDVDIANIHRIIHRQVWKHVA